MIKKLEPTSYINEDIVLHAKINEIIDWINNFEKKYFNSQGADK